MVRPWSGHGPARREPPHERLRMRVLITRAADNAARSAAALESLGHSAVVLPIFSYRDLAGPLPAGPFGALVFTAARSVAALAGRLEAGGAGRELRLPPAFCVGEKTAEAARKAGFGNAIVAGGTAQELAQTIAGRAGDLAMRRLLYPAPRHKALDLAGALPGFEIIEMPAYEAVAGDPGGEALRRALSQSDAAFIYSPRSACHLLELARRHACMDNLTRLTLIAISEKTARAVRQGVQMPVLVAAAPEERAMLALLGRGSGFGGGGVSD